MCYAGDRSGATEYFKNIGYECPPETNPAECEYMLKQRTMVVGQIPIHFASLVTDGFMLEPSKTLLIWCQLIQRIL